MDKKRSLITAEIRKIDTKKMTITHVVNDKTLDRYSTFVIPKGAIVKNFLNNPTVLWSHNMDVTQIKIPIAKCIELDIQENRIKVTTQFNRNDPLSVRVFEAFRDGFLNAWSIGFMPLKYIQYTKENRKELNTKYGLTLTKKQLEEKSGWWGILVIYEWELLEYSACAVPANPNALDVDAKESHRVTLVTRGLLSEEDSKNLFVEKEEKVPQTDGTDGKVLDLKDADLETPLKIETISDVTEPIEESVKDEIKTIEETDKVDAPKEETKEKIETEEPVEATGEELEKDGVLSEEDADRAEGIGDTFIKSKKSKPAPVDNSDSVVLNDDPGALTESEKAQIGSETKPKDDSHLDMVLIKEVTPKKHIDLEQVAQEAKKPETVAEVTEKKEVVTLVEKPKTEKSEDEKLGDTVVSLQKQVKDLLEDNKKLKEEQLKTNSELQKVKKGLEIDNIDTIKELGEESQENKGDFVYPWGKLLNRK